MHRLVDLLQLVRYGRVIRRSGAPSRRRRAARRSRVCGVRNIDDVAAVRRRNRQHHLAAVVGFGFGFGVVYERSRRRGVSRGRRHTSHVNLALKFVGEGLGRQRRLYAGGQAVRRGVAALLHRRRSAEISESLRHVGTGPTA